MFLHLPLIICMAHTCINHNILLQCFHQRGISGAITLEWKNRLPNILTITNKFEQFPDRFSFQLKPPSTSRGTQIQTKIAGKSFWELKRDEDSLSVASVAAAVAAGAGDASYCRPVAATQNCKSGGVGWGWVGRTSWIAGGGARAQKVWMMRALQHFERDTLNESESRRGRVR